VGRGGAWRAAVGWQAVWAAVLDYEPGNHVMCLAMAASLPEIARSSCPLTSSRTPHCHRHHTHNPRQLAGFEPHRGSGTHSARASTGSCGPQCSRPRPALSLLDTTAATASVAQGLDVTSEIPLSDTTSSAPSSPAFQSIDTVRLRRPYPALAARPYRFAEVRSRVAQVAVVLAADFATFPPPATAPDRPSTLCLHHVCRVDHRTRNCMR
jgi:hypothetical protein